MGYVVFAMLVLALLVVVEIVLTLSDERGAKELRGPAAGLFLAVLAIGSVVAAYATVSAGNIGIEYSFGAIVGQRGEGLQWIAPWHSLGEASIQIQGHKFGPHRQ